MQQLQSASGGSSLTPSPICTMQGIDMLIKEFNYHIAYKRWNDTFTAIPFKPK
jgi:hypothetical protein